MKPQISIDTFHEMLNDETAQSPLMSALKKLTEIGEHKSITEMEGPMPLGSWEGWSF